MSAVSPERRKLTSRDVTFHTGGWSCAGPVHTPGHTLLSRFPVVGTACTYLTDGETEADKYNLPQVTQLISGQARHGWAGSGARFEAPRCVPHDLRRLRRLRPLGPLGPFHWPFAKCCQKLTISLSQPGPLFSKNGSPRKVMCPIPKKCHYQQTSLGKNASY